jgi:hypothetical protein
LRPPREQTWLGDRTLGIEAAFCKGFGCRPVERWRAAPGAGVGKPPGNEPAGAGRDVGGLWGFDGCGRLGAALGPGLIEVLEGLVGGEIATGVA